MHSNVELHAIRFQCYSNDYNIIILAWQGTQIYKIHPHEMELDSIERS